jgi:hypothetical protein
MGKRDRYAQANMRGGLGVRKRLSEESMRDSYRLNGVQTGSAVVRAHDKYFADFTKGFDVGIIVRKTASVVQIRWIGDEETTSYSQGDARYEVDRGRWRILGPVQGNPLDPFNPIAEQLNALRGTALTGTDESGKMGASESPPIPTPPTEETEMQEKSNAAREREAAQKALANGDFAERETYTAKQVAGRLGTDAKTMRKFFRSTNSTVEPVGQGGRYEFDARDLPKIKREFDGWQKKIKARTEQRNGHATPEKLVATVPITDIIEKVNAEFRQVNGDDMTMDQLADTIERAQEEPTDDELAELEAEELDLELED